MSRRERQQVSSNRTAVRCRQKRTRPQCNGDLLPRLIIDANCTTCGPLDADDDPFTVPHLALQHASATNHVVVLNGTADVPDNDFVISKTGT